jgi:hypothetical protein
MSISLPPEVYLELIWPVNQGPLPFYPLHPCLIPRLVVLSNTTWRYNTYRHLAEMIRMNEPKNPPQEQPPSQPGISMLRSATRLLIGSVEVGLSTLLDNIQGWEKKLNAQGEPKLPDRPIAASGYPNASQLDRKAEIIPLEVQRVAPCSSEVELSVSDLDVEPSVSTEPSLPPEGPSDLLHYGMVGLLFESQDALLEALSRLDRLAQAAKRLSAPWLRPIRQSRLLRPIQQRYDALARRGEAEVGRWIVRGYRETHASRRLAEVAVRSAVDQSIDALTNNVEIQELVQAQSTGLANEVIEELRERTVSADSFLEGVARRFFHRRPRQTLPEPPPEVRERASGFRPPKKKGAAQP